MSRVCILIPLRIRNATAPRDNVRGKSSLLSNHWLLIDVYLANESVVDDQVNVVVYDGENGSRFSLQW